MTDFATVELARRVEDAGLAFNEGWLSAGPGVEIRRFGPVLASATPAMREVDFVNRVLGLGVREAELVDDVLAFYRDRQLQPWLELLPEPGFDRLAARLAEAGGRQIGFHTLLFGPPATPPGPNAVREIGPDEAALFAELHLAGVGVPEHARAWGRASVARWVGRGGWRCYVADVDGTPAAAGALVVHEGVGYLADAATDPRFRGRGCQTALIRRRIADAALAGCDLVAAQAEFGSTSQRNLERGGLRICCTKAVWRVFRSDRGEPRNIA